MIITDVACVEYTGHHHSPDGIFQERLRRPVDVYPEWRRRPHQQFPLVGADTYEVSSIFLHITTDSGDVGTVAQLSPEQAHVILKTLRPLLIGQDPFATEYLWDLLYRSSIHGRKGLGMVALSAVDCALWDIRGNALGLPVHRLLGGATQESAPAYVSTLGESLEVENVRQLARRHYDEGFRAMKWFPRWGPGDGSAGVDRIVELVGTIREAVGPEVRIMLDAWSSWDVAFTLAVARATADLGVDWIEEPLLADHTNGYRTLQNRLGGIVRIAGGEHEYTRWGYAELIRGGYLDVYQPDPHWAGGISETTKILAQVSAAGSQVIPHGQSLQCNAAVTFASSPAVVPEMEYLSRLMPVYQHFLANPIQPRKGRIDEPTTAGLGMQIDTSKVVAERVLEVD